MTQIVARPPLDRSTREALRPLGVRAATLAGAAALAACVGDIGDRPEGAKGTTPQALCSQPDPAASPLRRLTRWEYDHTVADLLGDTTGPASSFVPESSQFGFDNNAAGAALNPLVVEQFETAATALAAQAVTDLPGLLQCDVAEKGQTACAKQFVRSFGRRAYRRPLTDDETARFDEFYAKNEQAYGFSMAIELVVRAALQSPHFLYRIELGMPSPETPGALRLSPYEVANRLSYLFWGSMPDDELMQAAEAGALSTPDEVAAQARRLLAAASGERAVKNFYAQWAQVGMLQNVDREAPELTPAILDAMRTEVETLADAVVRKGDGKWSTLLTAPTSYMNAELAAFYGIEGPIGDGFEEVSLDPNRYSGIMTRGALMALLAHPRQPSPVLRGKFVREQLLCSPLPPPPNNVDTTLPPIDPSATAREQLEQKTSVEPCSSCHGIINPPGFAFEHFDEVGRWRDADHGLTIDASGELGASDVAGHFDDHTDLLAMLDGSDQARRCVVLHWFRYAYGRDKTEADSCSVDQLETLFEQSDGNIEELLVGLTQTPAFLYRTTLPVGAP